MYEGNRAMSAVLTPGSELNAPDFLLGAEAADASGDF